MELVPVVLQDFETIDVKKPDNHGALGAAVEFILHNI